LSLAGRDVGTFLPRFNLAPLEMLLPLLVAKAVDAGGISRLDLVLVLRTQLVVGPAVVFTYEIINGEVIIEVVLAKQSLIDRVVDAIFDG
jgi:hypothetical protein